MGHVFQGHKGGVKVTISQVKDGAFPSSGLTFISQTDHPVLTVFLIVVPEQTWEKSFVHDVDGLII